MSWHPLEGAYDGSASRPGHAHPARNSHWLAPAGTRGRCAWAVVPPPRLHAHSATIRWTTSPRAANASREPTSVRASHRVVPHFLDMSGTSAGGRSSGATHHLRAWDILRAATRTDEASS